MANADVVIRAFVRAALAAADPVDQKDGNKAKASLLAIILGKYTTNIADGVTMIHTMEAGGEVTFQIPPGLGPTDIMALCEQGINLLDTQPDITNVNLSVRRISRLRARFSKNNLSRGAGWLWPWAGSGQ